MELYRIRISLLPNTYFLFEPIEYYFVNSQERRVLIYQLSYIDEITPANNMTTRIPYYISDGHTNHFRANMILPFICFQDVQSLTVCPFDVTYSRLPQNGLMKLNIGRNFDTTQISTYIEDIIYQQFGHNIFTFMTTASRNNTIGVTSVLPRIQNILDYFIAITSDSIINIRNPVNYRPVYTQTQQYNIDFVDNVPNMINYGLNSQNVTLQRFNHFLNITDYYRGLLSNALNDQYIHFVQYQVITVQSIINLLPQEISTLEFNTLIGTCNGDVANPLTHITPLNVNLVDIYAQISHLLYQQLIDYIDYMPINMEEPPMDIPINMEEPPMDIPMEELRRLHFFNNVRNMLIPALYNAPFNNLLETNIAGWKTLLMHHI